MTRKVEVKLFKTSKLCEVPGCTGELEATGVVTNAAISMKGGSGSIYEHRCTVCGIEKNFFGSKFPIFTQEEVNV